MPGPGFEPGTLWFGGEHVTTALLPLYPSLKKTLYGIKWDTNKLPGKGDDSLTEWGWGVGAIYFQFVIKTFHV